MLIFVNRIKKKAAVPEFSQYCTILEIPWECFPDERNLSVIYVIYVIVYVEPFSPLAIGFSTAVKG